MQVIRETYSRMHRRDLVKDIVSETSSWFQKGLVALVRGPLFQDIHDLYDAMEGLGTKETVLNDVLLSRSNADMQAIKSAYHNTFRRRLEDDVKGDLSMKTERHFLIVLSAQRAEDLAPPVPADIGRDVDELYAATEGRTGTDEIKVCSILSLRNDNQIRAIAFEYKRRYQRNLEDVIRKVGCSSSCHSSCPLSQKPCSHDPFQAGVLRPHGRGAIVPITQWRGQVHASGPAARDRHGRRWHQGSSIGPSRSRVPLGPQQPGQHAWCV